MKTKKSKGLIIAIIITIILLLGVGTFAGVYLYTDLLKSDKELFFEYIGEMNIVDSKVEAYADKLLSTSYESNMNVSLSSGDAMMNMILGAIGITLESKVDVVNENYEYNVDIKYADESIFPISMRKVGNIVGFQTDHVSPRYVAADLNTSMTATNQTLLSIVEFAKQYSIATSGTEISTELIDHIASNYGEIINKNLAKTRFSKEVVDGKTGYVLTLVPMDVLLIVRETMTNLKTDDYLKGYLADNFEIENVDELADELIDEINSELAGIASTEEVEIKITVWVNDGKAEMIELAADGVGIKFEKTSTDDSIVYSLSMEDTLEGSILYTTASYSGLSIMANVSEEITIGMKQEGAVLFEAGISSDVVFVENLNIEALDGNNALILNQNRTAAQNDALWEAIETRIGEVISEKMMLMFLSSGGLTDFNMEEDYSTMMSTEENNAQYNIYVGAEMRGSVVKGLFSVVEKNIIENTCTIERIYIDDQEYAVTTTVETIKELIDVDKSYVVSMYENTYGYIDEIQLEEIEVSE